MAHAVFFLDPAQGVVREMKYSTFKEFLSGGFGLPDFAGQNQLAAYVGVGQGMNIYECVLFCLPLDERGEVQAQWDLPFEQLTQTAGRGPDLGGGPIRLTTSIQCSVPWHQAKLWDPKRFPDVFEWLVKVVKQNRLGLEVEESADEYGEAHEELSVSPSTSSIIEKGVDSPFSMLNSDQQPTMPPHMPYPMPMMPTMPYGYDPSQLPMGYYPGMIPPNHMQTPQHHPMGHQAPGQARSPVPSPLHHPDNPQQHPARHDESHQTNLNALMQQHQQELAQYKANYESKLISVSQAHEQSLDEVSGELQRLKKKIEALLSHKASLEEICEAQRTQIHDLGRKLTDTRKRSEVREKECVEAITRKYEETYARKFQELDQAAKKKIKAQSSELQKAKQRIQQLQNEVTELRRDGIRAVGSGEDDMLSKLDSAGITFIAFHAGAGHMSVPINDIGIYIDNPLAYAAKRCGVSEESYRLWLQHDQNPTCAYHKGTSVCGCKIPKVDLPSEFRPGISDRCEKHRSLTADWDNVVNFGQ